MNHHPRSTQTFSYADSDEEGSYVAIPPAPPIASRGEAARVPRSVIHDDVIATEILKREQSLRATRAPRAPAPGNVHWTTEEQASIPTEDESRGCCGSLLSRKQANVIVVVFLVVLAFLLGLLVGGFMNFSSKNDGALSSGASGGDDGLYPDSSILVGAYYYPWHSDDFHGGTGYVRDQLNPRQEPTLGEYDDSEPETIAQHLAWSRQANVRLWVTSWRGDGKREDLITRETILPHSDLGDHKIALLYETFGRIREDEEFSLHRVVADIEFISASYFDHPNYLRMNGKPVLFVYLTRKLERIGLMDNVITLMRQAARVAGHELYIVGDHAFREAPDNEFSGGEFNPFTSIDAITNYDVYGSIGKDGYAGEDAVEDHYQNKMAGWRDLAASHGCGFIPAASPGYNDLGVRPEAEHAPLSRKLTPESEYGSLFVAGLRESRKLLDSSAGNILMITSFNEWHEDTQIEPTVGRTTSLPEELTYGLEYEGYGELYLNILREETYSAEALQIQSSVLMACYEDL
eukprot:CAMPEP_0117034558 /NCGR_PEP_ID=MMETSP0472-20121206/24596_1 /TAXON_ID=693140 ORGANISM="Tiarina fusus, Strain LIS" /NCGR_SAMPLE_ID=MMETSP0472 /ASSEMBLY_ACC=CAM_ASM_000603 /LENGTH=518 /DNA_ID=CAMNT_0004743763 /DNA_START=38 /DNA_END=1595 /DNA_ORIENTATION=+